MAKDFLNENENILSSNRQYFESCIVIAKRLFQEGLYEDSINYIEQTASFGWFNFSGYYKSEELEMLLAKIQQKILPQPSQQLKREKTGKVLHICSEVYTHGGHSKLLYNWIKNDLSKQHTILCTRFSMEELEEVSKFYLPNIPNLQQISIKSASKIKSVQLLNQQNLNEYDIIFLHIHPDETIPNIVLSQKDITTPVCFINHADHVFWLGTSISDIVLQIRESNIALDEKRRGISVERQFFLPIPIENVPDLEEQNRLSKTDNNDIINILSTGSAYKYNPNEHYNFLKEAYKIVEENPETFFNVVGITPDSSYGIEYKHDRIILHGILSSLELASLEKTIHIYVEGFPMASFTALLQSALQKIPFHLHYKPLPLFKLFNDNEEKGIVYPKDLHEWHDNMRKLIRDKNYRTEIAQKQYDYMLNNFSIEIWKSRLSQLYNKADANLHLFWQPNHDIYYDGDNEKLLVTIDKRRFSHYNFTTTLSLSGKYLVYKMSKSKNINIDYLKTKKILKYFLK